MNRKFSKGNQMVLKNCFLAIKKLINNKTKSDEFRIKLMENVDFKNNIIYKRMNQYYVNS